MGIIPTGHGEWGWGRNAPRKSSWGSPRGIFCCGDGYGEPKPDGDFPVAISTQNWRKNSEKIKLINKQLSLA
jgi:hypothetical protein